MSAVVGLGRHQLDLLAQAVSFGIISINDLAPASKRTALLSKTYRARSTRALARLRELEALGLLEPEDCTELRFLPTVDARAALEAAGYAPAPSGLWLKPGAARPGWAS